MDDAVMPKRIGIGLICTLMAVSGLWFVAAGEGHRTSVTLTVESQTRTVRTSAANVGQLLAEQRIPVLPHDLVRPPTTAPLTEGLEIEVRRAFQVGLVVDGKGRSVITVARTVGEMLRSAGIDLPEGSIVDPSVRSTVRPGLSVSLRRPSPVTLRHDDVQEVIVTTAPSIRDLLAERRIAWSTDDVIEPELSLLPEQGLVITVSRSGTHDYTTHERVPAPIEVHDDPGMLLGKEVIVDPGREGLIDRIYRTEVVDGALKSRVLLQEIVLDAPSPRIIARGTKEVADAPPPVDPTARSQEGAASWYSRAGMTAAHPTLPFGTQVKVTNLATGTSIYVTVDDRGPFVGGRIIDLSDGAFKALAPLNAGVISVRIEW
jgi:resuscitation-promoting factor RpfB